MKYYIARNGAPAGPYEVWQLRYEGVTPDTLVWYQGLSEWTKASDIPEVADVLSAVETPPPFDAYAYECRLYRRSDAFDRSRFYPRPNNYLAEAIIVTFLCSPIIGIISIIYSSKVNSFYNRGQYEEAERASVAARNWVIGSIVFGIFFWAIFVF